MSEYESGSVLLRSEILRRLIELKLCSIKTLTTLTQEAKRLNCKDVFYLLDDLFWKPEFEKRFPQGPEIPSWYNMYSALSTQQQLKARNAKLKEKIALLNKTCVCNLWCAECDKHVSSPYDLLLTCPNCQENYGIMEWERSHSDTEGIMTSLSRKKVLCNECRLS
jgi:hypothetical protein